MNLWYLPYYSEDIIECEVHGARSEKKISQRFALDKVEKIITIQVAYYIISY